MAKHFEIASFCASVAAIVISLASFGISLKQYHRGTLQDQRSVALDVQKLLDQAFDLMGGAPGSRHIRSWVKPNSADLEETNRLISQAEIELPDSASVKLCRGRYNVLTGNYEEARKVLQDSYRLNNKDPQICCNLGVALMFLNDSDNGVKMILEAIRLDSNCFAAQVDLAQAYLDCSRYKEATLAAVTVTQSDPSFPAGWYLLGKAQAGLKQDPEAALAFTRAASLDPALDDAWLALGESQYVLGKYKEACTALQRAVDLGNTDAGDLLKQARAHAQ